MKTKADLEREAQRLIEAGQMPTLEELIKAISETREKYRPLIIAARKMDEHEN